MMIILREDLALRHLDPPALRRLTASYRDVSVQSLPHVGLRNDPQCRRPLLSWPRCGLWHRSSSHSARVRASHGATECAVNAKYYLRVGRDAPSSYKLLATSVRNLRNVLEEVEDDYDQTRTLGPDDVKLLNQIGRSHDILSRLDLALQSYRCSAHKDVNMNAVSDLKTALDVTTHQLRLAFEAITTGDIPLKLDMRNIPDHARASASIEDSSASRSRKSSMWSLGQRDSARSPGASDATSVHNERSERYSGEEKQVLSPSACSASESRASMDFRAPFADPLSMGIEDATSFILGGGDDDLGMSAYARPVSSRSRAESNVSTATETFVSAPVSPDLERKPSGPSGQPSITDGPAAPTIDVKAANMQYPDDVNSGERAEGHAEGRRESEAKIEESHLSPDTATRELAMKRTRTNSNASVTGSTTPDAEISTSAASESEGLSTKSEKTISRPGSSHQAIAGVDATSEGKSLEEILPAPPASAPLPPSSRPPSPPKIRTRSLPVGAADESKPARQLEPEPNDLVEDLSKSIERAFDGGQSASLAKPSTPPQSTAESASDVPADQQETKSPPAPTRRPPPPPPAIRRSNANVKLKSTQSKYRITNDAPENSSSDDELYSTSRPASPVKVTSPAPVQSPPLATPTIQIDQSALDDASDKKDADSSLDDAKDHETSETSDDGPQLPQSVYTPPSSAKPPIFAKPKGSDSSNDQSPSHVTEAKPPQSPPAPQSPPSQHNSPRPRSSQSSQSSPPLQSSELPPSVQKRVEAAVRAGDKLLAKEIEARFQREGKPPPVPPRPPKSRYVNNRPRATTTNSSPAIVEEKEISVPEPGLELDENLLATKPRNPRLVPRISVDHALNVAGTDFPQAPEPAESLDGTRHARSASTSQLPPPQLSARSSHSPGLNGHRLTGWYGPGADDTSQSALDAERIEHIEHFWNSMDWDNAGEYLMGYLESLVEQDNMAVVRRIRHLLAVAATYKGDIQHAITLFLSVLDFSETADLNKPGNCEACYWLGDLYAMSNLRDEALLAYCAAQWGGVFNDPDEPHLTDLIRAEQEAVQLGSPKSEFKARWSQEGKEGCGTILDPKILPPAVVKHLFETEPRRDGRMVPLERIFSLDPNKPRSSALFSLSSSPQWAKFRRNKISSFHFLPNGPWPLQYDPTFTMANVKRERLLSFECDLLSVLQSKDGEAKIPKTAPMSLSKMDCFTCNDLGWLITSVRDCLRMLEMEWSEVANEQGGFFVVRNTLMDGPTKLATMKMATVHYFAISLFRQTFRTSYGVEICSHGVSSARIMEPSNLEYEKGVHHTEPRRIRKVIREALEEADKRRPKTRRRVSSVGLGISRASSEEQQQPARVGERGNPPPVPPRMSKA